MSVLSPISHLMDHECVLCVSLCLVARVLARAVGLSVPPVTQLVITCID